jgi:polyphosphate:AMP phosphotransferase
VLDRLTEWLDVRHVDIHTVGVRPASDEEAERPEFWRFWRKLPARGRIGLFLGSWYSKPIVERVMHDMKAGAFERQLTRIARLERMLVQDGALILKFWLHLSEEDQKKRFEKLESDKRTKWRVTKEDWRRHKMYRRFAEVSETAIRQTDTSFAPWFLVEAHDSRYRDLTIGRTIADALERRLSAEQANGGTMPSLPVLESMPPASAAQLTILDKVDLTRKIDPEEYERRIEAHQEEIGRLARDAYEQRRSTIMVFEGWDAAGKGGAIRRVSQALDARLLNVIQIAAPTDEERAHHYLWRFWRHVPRAGRVTIYDRSWYGRVLVERVEGFAGEAEWKRAYNEINDFEEQLTEHGILLLKFWIHISKEEQLRRFEEREVTSYKQHKIGAEDWRNREKWDRYEEAVNEMVARCSTSYAAWTIVPGNDKKYARIEVLKTIKERMEGALA